MSESPNDLLTCPYNMAHQVERYRMQFHLEKCQKQNKKMGKRTCPFNKTHVMDEAELDFHVKSCPDRIMFDSQCYITDSTAPFQPLVSSEVPVIESEECWDDENCTGYLPDPSKKADHVIQKVRGAAPAERRRARMEGIRTYQGPKN